MTYFCQVLTETLNKEFSIHFSEESKICNPSSNTAPIFLWFFGSKVGILNIIMLTQILSELKTTWTFKASHTFNGLLFRYYQNWKQHEHSRLAIHSMVCYSANFSARNWLRNLEGPLGFQRKILRWTTYKIFSMCSFKQFRSNLNGLPKVVR